MYYFLIYLLVFTFIISQFSTWLYSKNNPCHVIGSQTFKPPLSLQFELLSCTFSIHEKVAKKSVLIPSSLLLFFLTPNFEAVISLKIFKELFWWQGHVFDVTALQSWRMACSPNCWNENHIGNMLTLCETSHTRWLWRPKLCLWQENFMIQRLVWCRGKQMGRSCFSGLWHTTEEGKGSLKCQISACERLRVDWLRFWSCTDEITWEKSEVLKCIRGRFLHVTEENKRTVYFLFFFNF